MSGRIKILCVDNKKELLDKLEATITKNEKYSVILTESRTEGFEILEKEPRIQVVISGSQIAIGDGIEFLSQVGAKWPGIMRLILADSTATAVVESIQAGTVEQSITSPWNDNDLLSAIASALQYRKVQRDNKKLRRELHRRETELQEINGNLEAVVAKRTEALDIRNRVLQISQGVMDVLPIVVFGIDPEQVIVQCNEFARDLFPCGIIGPLGNDRHDVFPPEINALIDQIENERNPQMTIEVRDRKFHAEVRRLHETRSQGIVLVLIPADK